MNWTNKQPNAVGYWWYRSRHTAPIVMRVFGSEDGSEEVLIAVISDDNDSLLITPETPGEWGSEPIPEPEEAAQ